MIPTITFYSFKGGVGRTGALANVATHLANEGHTVLALDMDLEAPGLGMWLPPVNSLPVDQPGLVDLIERSVNDGRIPSDLGDYMYEAEVPRVPKGGRVFVVSGGLLDGQYPLRLSRLQWDGFFTALEGKAFFDQLRERLASEHGIDRVLVDARTGFSDPAAVAVRSLADLVVLMFRPDPQNLGGLRQVIRDLRADHRNEEDPGLRYVLVVSPLPPATPGSEREKRQRAQLLEAANQLRLVPQISSEEDLPADDLQDAVDNLILRIDWHLELAETNRPVVSPGGVTSLSLGYVRLAEEIERRVVLLQAARGGTRAEWSSACRARVLNANLGLDEGTQDPLLFDRFVRTEQVTKAFSLETAFVFGNKGAGKSAVFRYLLEDPERALGSGVVPTVVPIHGDVQGLALLSGDDLPRGDSGQSAFQRFWFAYMTARLSTYAHSATTVQTQLELVELRQEVERLQEAKAPEEAFQRAAKIALQQSAGKPLVLLIDATERLFGHRPLLQAPSFRGLAEAWLQWRSALPNVYFKAFVRDQALLDPSGVLVDRSHIHGRSTTLAWEEEDAWWFLLRRLLAELEPNQGIPQTIAGLLGDLKTKDQPYKNIRILRTALEMVFPPKAYPGENEAPFHRWLLARVKDGNGTVYPRALLSFARGCQEFERRADRREAAPTVFDRATVLEAFKRTSKQHATDMFAELGYLRPYLEVFGRDPLSSWQVRFTTEELEGCFERVAVERGTLDVPPSTALKILVHLGILKHEPGSRWNGEPYDYSIPSLYKFGLVNPKGRV